MPCVYYTLCPKSIVATTEYIVNEQKATTGSWICVLTINLMQRSFLFDIDTDLALQPPYGCCNYREDTVKV